MHATSLIVRLTCLASAAAAAAQQRLCPWNRAGPLKPDSPGTLTTNPLPIDWASAARTGRWQPWTKHPHCATRSARQRAQPQYCVYTHSAFRGGGGLTVVTTPDTAATVAPLVDGVDPAWLPRIRGGGHSPARLRWPPPFAVVDVPGKGKGVVANASIPRGEVLFREQPALVSMLTPPAYVEPLAQRALLQRGLAQLPEREQRRVLALAHQSRSPADVVRAIQNANAFSITINEVQHSALYPDISRINHACKPNAYVRYTRSTLEMEVVAYQDIGPGTELSISYTPLNIQTKDRREMLRTWGFECNCALCSSPAAAQAESDANRQRVQDLLDDMDDAETRAAGGTAAVTRLADEVLDVMRREGILAQQGDVLAIAAQVLLDMDDAAGARRLGELAVERLAEFAGPDSERCEQARMFMRLLDRTAARKGR